MCGLQRPPVGRCQPAGDRGRPVAAAASVGAATAANGGRPVSGRTREVADHHFVTAGQGKWRVACILHY